MVSVLLVGKAAPERGGIPSFLEMLTTSELAQHHRLELLNLADGDATPEGGRATWGNIRRTSRDVRRVWRAAHGRDVVHIHTAGAPVVTMARLGLLAPGCAAPQPGEWSTSCRRRGKVRPRRRRGSRRGSCGRPYVGAEPADGTLRYRCAAVAATERHDLLFPLRGAERQVL
jgi:hypothetical protein